jgi:ABC-type nitrate/sulfonate/bicarbonate transport system permease component
MLYIRHLWITLIETLLGFVVGSIVALVLVQHPLNKLNI